MEFKFTKKNIIIIIVFIIIMFSGLLLFNYRNLLNKKINNDKIFLVKEYGRFFSISNAADKYISYLNKRDKNNLILLLNKNYLEINNITNQNILNKLTLLEENNEFNFEARKMYYENIDKNMIRYYIYGYLNKNVMEEYSKPKDYYLIIDLDENNKTFEVTPYDGKIFKEDLK